jgi:hypothetical protein
MVIADCTPSGGGAVTGHSAYVDGDGAYRIFNVPAGSCRVRGYASGVNYDAVTVTVAAAGDAVADLTLNATPTVTVSGSVNFVNPGECVATSVILAVASTFDPAIARGEAPPGLRAPQRGIAPNVTSTFSIAGVPDGSYVVLAAFENDGCVRDLSGGGGTDIQTLSVVNGAIVGSLATFKVTGALDVITPGAAGPEIVTSATPTLSWVDDSGEDSYLLEVYDAFGDVVWSTILPKSTGSNPSVTYAGTALVPGMYYQFKAFSKNTGGAVISSTEDLKGVFQYVPTSP